MDKTLPWQNCVRLRSDEESNTKSQNATPFYNATLRSECSVDSYMEFFDAESQRTPAFREACLLTGLWLRQRGIDTGMFEGGLGSFEVSALTSWLLQSGAAHGRAVLSTGYTSFQLFKALLQFLATRDLIRDPIIFGGHRSISSKDIKSSCPVAFDTLHGLNILFKMSPCSYRHVSLTLSCFPLGDNSRFSCTITGSVRG